MILKDPNKFLSLCYISLSFSGSKLFSTVKTVLI